VIVGPSILRSILPTSFSIASSSVPSFVPSFLPTVLPACYPTLPSSNTCATTLRMSHFPAPCLTVTRERRVSERNHPYNCWGRAGTNGEKERRHSQRAAWVWGWRANEGMGRVETADKVCRSIERGREKGRLELTPSYFRMEEFAGVFLLFVSELAYRLLRSGTAARCFLRCVRD